MFALRLAAAFGGSAGNTCAYIRPLQRALSELERNRLGTGGLQRYRRCERQTFLHVNKPRTG